MQAHDPGLQLLCFLGERLAGLLGPEVFVGNNGLRFRDIVSPRAKGTSNPALLLNEGRKPLLKFGDGGAAQYILSFGGRSVWCF